MSERPYPGMVDHIQENAYNSPQNTRIRVLIGSIGLSSLDFTYVTAAGLIMYVK